MSSAVHFKFKSQREPSRVTFDGTAISVFDLKREIININKLGDGTDFELAIYNENDNTEYNDDTTLIPRSTSVVARRLPPIRPGRGGAARYVSGKAPINARHSATNGAAKASGVAIAKGADMNLAQTEEERIKAMFSLEGEQWRQKQQEMATEQRVPFGTAGKGFPKKNANIPEGEPPRGYVCYRCGKKGHWIQACPTNDDPTFEGKARIKRTTGIPRSMLKTIDKSELEHLDETTRQQMMINGDGDYVIAQTDDKEWKKHQEKAQASAAAQEKAKQGDEELQSRGLECPIDKRLFLDPVQTPCCQKTYCNECISTALIDSDLTCPSCSTENVTLEDLVPDRAVQDEIQAFQAEKTAVSKKDDEETGSVTSNVSVKAATPSGSAPILRTGSKSPNANGADGKAESKKRRVDAMSDPSALVPTTSEMKRQRSNDSQQISAPLSQEMANKAIAPATSSHNNTGFGPMMPPDVSQMMPNPGNPNGNFAMPMPGMGGMGAMAGLPFMPFMPPHMNMGMDMNMNMNMNMNMMNPGMMSMTGNFMPHNFDMNGINGMGFNPGMDFSTSSNTNSHHDAAMYGHNNQYGNQQQKMYGNQSHSHNHNHTYTSATRIQSAPAGPRNQNYALGPSVSASASASSAPLSSSSNMANRFSNQQRHLGKEEDNAYARQPVNPYRHQNRQKRVRPSDYRELGT